MSGEACRIIRRLLTVADRVATKGSHLAMVEPNEHLGICNTRRHYVGGTRVPDGAGYRMEGQTLDGACSPLCVEFTAIRTEAQTYLDEHEPRQITLEMVS